MQRIALSGLFVAIAATGAASVRADDDAGRKKLEKELLPKLVTVVATLGRGDTDKAIDQFESLIGRKFGDGKSPFENNEREIWEKTFDFFAKKSPQFESVDLVGIQKLSSQAYKVNLIGNGKLGPVLFQCELFEYRGELKLATVRFEVNWPRIEQMTADVKEKLSTRYEIPARKE